MTRFFSQGDILIEQISSMSTLALAQGRGRAKSAVIAEGEASGHCHRLVGEFVFYRDDHLARDISDQLYLGHVRVGRSRAQLLHEEHATVALNPAFIAFVGSREPHGETAMWEVLAYLGLVFVCISCGLLIAAALDQ
jgi:hypothetical protein